MAARWTTCGWRWTGHFSRRRRGVARTIAAVPLWKFLSLMEECRNRARRALVNLEQVAPPDTHQSMKLLEALGAALRYDGDSLDELPHARYE